MNPLPNKIVIHKSVRTLSLMHGDSVLRTYKISLGTNPVGPKQQEGDGKTPEGRYTVLRHNPKSNYHLALKVSYPNPEDIRQAKARHVSPGGDIMIHGLPNNYIASSPPEDPGDWTLGCIAVNNKEIEEIYANIPDGTSVEIFP